MRDNDANRRTAAAAAAALLDFDESLDPSGDQHFTGVCSRTL